MANNRILVQSAYRDEDRPDTTLLAAANACAKCALRAGPACSDCIDHALKGYGLVHHMPIVRH
jgi:hypothetical protein